jgi:hypothetical protein
MALSVAMALFCASGCSSLAPSPTPPRTTPPSQQTRRPAAPQARAAAPVAQAKKPVEAAPLPAPAPALAPISVVGLSQTQVRDLLGAPSATSDHGPAQTWTYRSNSCSVGIAFYYDVTRRDFFALNQHADAAGQTGGGEDCLARIHDQHAS